MTKSLRKKHRQVWTIAAFLLPAGILLSWLAIPVDEPVKLLQQQTLSLLPVVVKTKKEDGYTVVLRSNKENTEWQLEWVNRKPLLTPSAVIYRVSFPMPHVDTTETKTPVAGELIGRIEARGTYTFPLPTDSLNRKKGFALYDFIHHDIIARIEF